MPVDELKQEISRVLRAMGVEDGVDIVLERPRNPEHGDFASNVAMALARPLRRPPRQLAEQVVQRLDLAGAGIRSAEVAGPGFINFRLASDVLWNGLAGLVAAVAAVGRSTTGQDRPVMVYRMVAKDTVEERILALQAKKRALSDVALGEAGQAASLTREDLLSLLE